MRTPALCLTFALLFLGPAAAAAAAGPSLADGQLAQSRADDDRRREEEREQRIKERLQERRDERERDLRERNRQHLEERRRRQDRATEDLKRRREKEIFERFRRMEEGYPTTDDRRRMARDRKPPEPDPDTEMLLKLFPPAWVPGILAGRVERGWNADAVIAALGRPEKITRSGPETEVWHYPATRITLEGGAVRAVTPRPSAVAPRPDAGRNRGSKMGPAGHPEGVAPQPVRPEAGGLR